MSEPKKTDSASGDLHPDFFDGLVDALTKASKKNASPTAVPLVASSQLGLELLSDDLQEETRRQFDETSEKRDADSEKE